MSRRWKCARSKRCLLRSGVGAVRWITHHSAKQALSLPIIIEAVITGSPRHERGEFASSPAALTLASTPLAGSRSVGYFPVGDDCTFLNVSRFFCRPLIWSCISTSEEPNWATDPTGPPALPAFSSNPPTWASACRCVIEPQTSGRKATACGGAQ